MKRTLIGLSAIIVFCLGYPYWIASRLPPSFGVVDMKILISTLAKTHSESDHPPPTDANLKKMALELHQQLADFADKHQVILLSKKDVLGGPVADYTDEFLNTWDSE